MGLGQLGLWPIHNRCNKCDMMIKYLRKFRRDFGEEFGTKLFLKEMEEVKKTVESIRKKIEFPLVVVVCSLDCFLMVLGACNRKLM